MKIKKIVVTGEQYYIQRRQFLFEALSTYCEDIRFIPRSNDWYDAKLARLILKYLYAFRVFSLSKADTLFQRNERDFIAKSMKAQEEIRQLGYSPDLVFHIFNTYSPFWTNFDIPYVIYLDYTMALAEKSGSTWAYFINRKERDARFECERQMYDRAYHLFAMNNLVKTSLIEDYGINSQKVTVVGASGNFQKPYEGEKSFGTQQILFNGSDFKRKGGDLVLAAFKQVKQVVPEARLVIIGKKLPIREDGIVNPGYISSPSNLLNLFLKTDLVIAPSACDPFPRFVMEAMNYGVPCIVSANDGIPEIVENNVNGIVMHQPTSDLLAEHIINLLSNPSRLTAMSQAARAKIKTQLNWDKVASTIVQVLLT